MTRSPPAIDSRDSGILPGLPDLPSLARRYLRSPPTQSSKSSGMGMDQCSATFVVGCAKPTAAAVAAVPDQAAFNPLRAHSPRNDGEITADHRMPAELLAQRALGRHRAGEDKQAACLLVQPVHDPRTRERAFPLAPFLSGDG